MESKGTKELVIAITFNAIIVIAEGIGGFLTNSLTLLSDALHNTTDLASLFIALIALLISVKKPDDRRTYGYKRTGIIASLLNAFLLIELSILMAYKIVERIAHPQTISGIAMLILGLVGICVNLGSALFLRKHSRDNLNIRAASLHLFTDALSSVGVVLVGTVLLLGGPYLIDTIVSSLILVIVCWGFYSLLKDALNILLEGVPYGLDVGKVKGEIKGISDEIVSVHHLHIWQIDENMLSMTCHIALKCGTALNNADDIRHRIEGMLKDRFNIDHPTLQMEILCK
ncbi:MAG: cation diffusion facilitator family transporter [bacterium]